MANPILHKSSSTASAVPSAGSLTVRELAINTADGRLFTKTGAGAVVEFARKDLVPSYMEASFRSGKDSNGVFTTVGYKRADGTMIRSSVLSGGASPEYTTRTETLYATDGTTVTNTLVFTLSYTDGELTSEDLA